MLGTETPLFDWVDAMSWDEAFFIHRYDLPQLDFKAFLKAEDEAERHALHEAGHDWWAVVRLGMQRLNVSLVSQGTSSVGMRGEDIGTHEWLCAGVAGILAEARGFRKHQAKAIDRVDVNRLGTVADVIFAEVSANSADLNFAFPLPIPMGPSLSAFEPVSCSVADFAVPIKRDELNRDGILAALTEVASVLNNDDGWQEFLDHYGQFRVDFPAHHA